MTLLILRSVLFSAATVVGLASLLYALFRLQLRRYRSAVSGDLLARWDQYLEGLDPAQRRTAAATPPAQVIAAMVEL